MWTHTDDYNLLPNLYIRSQYIDGTFKFYEIYPCEGYVLRIPSGDTYVIDENGNYILDENGEKIVDVPYRTYGGATEFAGYDWSNNPENYHAELYVEGMEVFGNGDETVTE